jgi:hypothetical protein
MRNQTEYNKVVNFDEETNEITLLDHTFDNDNFKGAIGTKFEPVSKEEYDERTEEDNAIDYLIDSGLGLPEEFKREELNLSEDEAYIFNCSGGGRCFDKDFQGNVNVELSEIIREFES